MTDQEISAHFGRKANPSWCIRRKKISWLHYLESYVSLLFTFLYSFCAMIDLKFANISESSSRLIQTLLSSCRDLLVYCSGVLSRVCVRCRRARIEFSVLEPASGMVKPGLSVSAALQVFIRRAVNQSTLKLSS